MKKWLSIFAAISLTATAASAVVACGSNSGKKSDNDLNPGGDPNVYIFTNGDDQSKNSDWRLLGRRYQDYKPDKPLPKSDKWGAWNPFETGLGIGLDTSNPVVQAEDINWLYYLMFYGNLGGKINPSFKASPEDHNYNTKNSTFDGIRIDDIAGIDWDLCKESETLLNDLYGMSDNDANANDHLGYSEGMSTIQQGAEKDYFDNSSLNYDDDYHTNWEKSAEYYDDRNGASAPSLDIAKPTMATNLEDDETEDTESNPINPNVTYAWNHDNFRGTIVDETLHLVDKNFSYKNFGKKQQIDTFKASKIWYKNLWEKNKFADDGWQKSPKNRVALYADMLTNKDTVPTMFYGDLFEAERDYMSRPSAIAEPIMDILNARSKYVAGGQRRNTIQAKNGQIITNVRFGKGYYEDHKGKDGKEITADSNAGKNSGIVTLFSNSKNVQDKTLSVYVGRNHAGQKYANLLDTTPSEKMGLSKGLAADNLPVEKTGKIMGVPITNNPDHDKFALGSNTSMLTVGNDGFITIDVEGTDKPFIDGYLSMWVPYEDKDGSALIPSNVYVTEDQAKNMQTYKSSKKIFNSNSALDSHVLYQSFATMMPDQGLGYTVTDNDTDEVKVENNSQEKNKDYYAQLGNKDYAKAIADDGVTDIWMAPPYVSPNPNVPGQPTDMSQNFGYGYMMTDRYNLGDDKNPSKYGTGEQLINASKILHETSSLLADNKDGDTNRSVKLMLDYDAHQIVAGDVMEKDTFDVYNSKEGEWGHLLLAKKHVVQNLNTATSNNNYQYQYGGKYLADIHSIFKDIFETKQETTGEKVPWDIKIQNWTSKYETSYPLIYGVVTDSKTNAIEARVDSKTNPLFYEKKW